ncbi:hypothetical protein AC1031_007939 [Aphanomyces cochlioides]|nr:hypothetical protein AC1031_007939 [Aphanomyces cochlioides]
MSASLTTRFPSHSDTFRMTLVPSNEKLTIRLQSMRTYKPATTFISSEYREGNITELKPQEDIRPPLTELTNLLAAAMDLKQGPNDSLHLLVAMLRSTGEKVDGYDFSLIPQPMDQSLRDELERLQGKLPKTDAAYFKVTFHARSKCYTDNESLTWDIEPMPHDIVGSA